MFKWLSKNANMQPVGEPLQAGQITFLSEQDGNIERALKAGWVAYLKGNVHVTLACLARVRYANSSQERVALCLRADTADKKVLVESLSADFRRLFKTTETLDIVFLSSEQQSRLLRVAKPFYEQHAHQT
jgi:hypothetical protein